MGERSSPTQSQPIQEWARQVLGNDGAERIEAAIADAESRMLLPSSGPRRLRSDAALPISSSLRAADGLLSFHADTPTLAGPDSQTPW